MKKTMLAVSLLALLTPTIAVAMSVWQGVYEGTAYAVSGNPQANHQTKVVINCNGLSGDAIYTYPNGQVCHSDLTLQSEVGSVRTYVDDTKTVGCVDGKVKMWPDAVTGKHHFQWMYPNGTVDTQGLLDRTGHLLCPL